MPLSLFFNAKSIAVIGASRTPGHVGNVIVQNFLRSGYKGRLFPINPHAGEILGVRCYPSVTAVKERIEQAIIAVPAEAVLQVIRDCAKKRIRHVVIITAGFGEVGNHALQNKLGRLLRKHGIRAIGPNCLGVYDAQTGIDSVFIPWERIRRPPAGSLTILSQSGALGSTLLDLASLEHIGINKFVSYGNAVDIDITDLLVYLKDDRSTRAICAYIEGLRDGRAFLRAAKAVTAKKPLIVLKGGTTKAGSKAALSHTASLAGSAEVYRGAFQQVGCIIAKSFEEFVDLAEIFAKAPPAKGNRVAIITNSGGHAILASDAMERHGLPFAPFTAQTTKALGRTLAPVPVKNPLDLLGDATAERYRLALDACIRDRTVDIILLMCMPQTPLIEVPQLLSVVALAARKTKKPVICVTSGSTFAEQLKGELEKLGLPCYHFPEEAVRSMAKFVEYYHKK